jgi:hypothetical protein
MIDALRAKYPGVQMILECEAPRKYLWQDYGYPIVTTTPNYIDIKPTPSCPKDYLFFNMWFGVFNDILCTYGLSHINHVHTFNRQMMYYKLNSFLDLPTGPPVLKLRDLGLNVPPNTVLVENGPCSSGQCNNSINTILSQLIKNFPNLNFLLSYDIGLKDQNVVSGWGHNLLQLSDLSNKCIGFITQASGVNAASYTAANIGKPRVFFGWNYIYKIWDNSADVAYNYDQLKLWIEGKICKR